MSRARPFAVGNKAPRVAASRGSVGARREVCGEHTSMAALETRDRILIGVALSRLIEGRSSNRAHFREAMSELCCELLTQGTGSVRMTSLMSPGHRGEALSLEVDGAITNRLFEIVWPVPPRPPWYRSRHRAEIAIVTRARTGTWANSSDAHFVPWLSSPART